MSYIEKILFKPILSLVSVAMFFATLWETVSAVVIKLLAQIDSGIRIILLNLLVGRGARFAVIIQRNATTSSVP